MVETYSKILKEAIKKHKEMTVNNPNIIESKPGAPITVEVPNIHINKAFLEFQKETFEVTKDGQNPFHKNYYATWENLVETIRPSFNRLGLIYVHSMSGTSVICVVTHVESGQTMSSMLDLQLGKGGMQALGSAITYAKRYTLTAILGLISVDDDGNEASGFNVSKAKQINDNLNTTKTGDFI